MGYRRERARPLEKTMPEGKTTLAHFLKDIAPKHLEEHINFMEEIRTPWINDYRAEFRGLLERELNPEEAYLLGQRRKEIERKMVEITTLVRTHKLYRRISNQEAAKGVIERYREILKLLKATQGRGR